ncbi:MAG: alpha/beta hydrolase [Pseudonocardia sp.]|jgi:pimeloyl-ACP methyl ester carboxylesterase|nr:alpha/beta hydrolase [Pseudonocardia sp.]
MTTFALLHGGAHGPWQWDLLAPLLHELGHAVVTPDLPMDDPEKGSAEWARVTVEALDAVGTNEDVVVLGHSLAGLAVPVVAAARPVRHMVFLCAQVPMPGQSYGDYVATQPGAITLPVGQNERDELGRTVVTWPIARKYFYAACTEKDARRYHALLRPIAATAFVEPCPIAAWPNATSSYILATDDLAVGPEWSRRVCEERLGITPIELAGTHSPFLDHPAELAATLVRIARQTRAIA